MNFYRELGWGLLISLFIWVAIILTSWAVVHEVEYRRDLAKHKAQYMKWWHERDLNQHLTQKEWTR